VITPTLTGSGQVTGGRFSTLLVVGATEVVVVGSAPAVVVDSRLESLPLHALATNSRATTRYTLCIARFTMLSPVPRIVRPVHS
jgi:hypothetical protein